MNRNFMAGLLASLACIGTADAAELEISIGIPRLDVAEYHRPYVAVWIERDDGSVAANLAVWYQQTRAKPRDAEARAKSSAASGEDGSRWLPDLRQWWRRSGRSSELPIDGVTGATRPVGQHRLHFSSADASLSTLAGGNYRLVVEAAREVGGRELLRLPLVWPPLKPEQASVEGKRELGRVELKLRP